MRLADNRRIFVILTGLALLLSGQPSGGLDTRRSLARAYYEEERFKESAEAWQAVLRTGGGTAQDYLNLGLAQLAGGHHTQALAALETAREMAPDEPGVYFALGILEKREIRLPRAASALEE